MGPPLPPPLSIANLDVFLQSLIDFPTDASLPSPWGVVDGHRVAAVVDRVVRVARVRVIVVVCICHWRVVPCVC